MLSLPLPEELIDALNAERERRGCTLASLVRRLLAAGLEASGEASPDPGRLSALEARLAAVEARLEALPAAPAPRPRSPVARASLHEEEVDLLSAAEPPAGAITTAELAKRCGISAPAWRQWAANAEVGTVRHHPTAGSWRLVGRIPPPPGKGGSPSWAWEPA